MHGRNTLSEITRIWHVKVSAKQNNKKFHRYQLQNLNVTILDYNIWNWLSHTPISDDNKMQAM